MVTPLWGLSSLEALTLEEVFEETTVPTLGTESAPPWPGRVCFEGREHGAGSVPKSDGRGQRLTELHLCQLQKLSRRCSWTWESKSSLLWPRFTLTKCAPNFLPGSFSGYRRGQDSSFPPESISHCCLYTSICSALRGMLPRGERGMGAPPKSWLLSLPHAYIPVAPVQADEDCLGQSGVEDTGLVCVAIRVD